MHHPLSGKYIKIYLVMWVVIITAHILFLLYSWQITFHVSITDAVIVNFFTAGFGYTYWYVVRFLSPDRQHIFNTTISHILGILVGASLIIYLSQLLLNGIFSGNNNYLIFLRSSILWRGVVVVFYLVVITMVYYILTYQNKIRIKEDEEKELQNLLKHAELQMLKFQLNPHFIFNSLNSISSLTITEPAKAQEMVIRLSEFLRSSLGRENEGMHSLESELRQMEIYLEIEKVRFGERICYKKDIQEECLHINVPNMILQPIYENAIKFGLYDQLDDLIITTKAQLEENNLRIIIENNFVKESKKSNGGGIGLSNIAQRLKLIYNADHLVQVNQYNSKFEVQLLIPH